MSCGDLSAKVQMISLTSNYINAFKCPNGVTALQEYTLSFGSFNPIPSQPFKGSLDACQFSAQFLWQFIWYKSDNKKFI